MGVYSSSQKGAGELQMLGMEFSWKVKEYSKITPTKAAKSSNFEVSGYSYNLVLYKNIDMTISLHQDYSGSGLVKLRCKVSIIDRHGHERLTQVKYLMLRGNDTQVLLAVTKNELDRKKTDFFLDDTLTVLCKVSASNEDENIEPAVEIFLETLSSDLWKIYDCQTACDVVLHANNATFQAHRLVLSARSKVFAAMFQSHTTESQEGSVKMVDVEGPILANILYYIYTGKIRGLTPETVTGFLAVADNYDLVELKVICMKYLQHNLTVGNVCDVAALAVTFGDLAMKQSAENFITNNISSILQTEHWKEFAIYHSAFANEILSSVILTRSKQEI